MGVLIQCVAFGLRCCRWCWQPSTLTRLNVSRMSPEVVVILLHDGCRKVNREPGAHGLLMNQMFAQMHQQFHFFLDQMESYYVAFGLWRFFCSQRKALN
ncbi:hypothetical protein GN956_G5558 [Arapaima gigas]